jgi:hypothetical protein
LRDGTRSNRDKPRWSTIRATKHRVLTAVVFIFGCATGGVAAQLVVPQVRAGTSPTRWEYECLNADTGRGALTSTLNQLGLQGWELVSMSYAKATSGGQEVERYVVCSKRALP